MARKKASKDTLGLAGIALGAIALALVLNKPAVQEKVVNTYSTLPFPAFGIPNFNIGYPSFSTGSTVSNFTLPEAPAISLPNFQAPAALTQPVIGENPQAQTQNFSPAPGFSLPAFNASEIPFFGGAAKLSVTEAITDAILGGGISAIPKLSPQAAAIGVPAVQGTGLAVARTGLNIVESASAARGIAAPLAADLAIGGGTAVAGLGFGITGAATAASALALKEENTPGSLAGFGASIGFLAATPQALGLAGLPALAGGVPGVIAGAPFIGAGIAGGFLGNEVNKFLVSSGLREGSAVASGPIKPFSQNAEYIRANPGVSDTGTAFGTPDMTAGDFEANVSSQENFSSNRTRASQSSTSTPRTTPAPILGIPNVNYSPAPLNYSPAFFTPAGGYH